jgi:hypothetical protein
LPRGNHDLKAVRKGWLLVRLPSRVGRVSQRGSVGYLALACIGWSEAYAIPYDWIHSRLKFLNTTETDGGGYWHLYLVTANNGRLQLWLADGQRESLDSSDCRCRTNFVNFRLQIPPFICYKQCTESRGVASRAILSQLSSPSGI